MAQPGSGGGDDLRRIPAQEGIGRQFNADASGYGGALFGAGAGYLLATGMYLRIVRFDGTSKAQIGLCIFMGAEHQSRRWQDGDSGE